MILPWETHLASSSTRSESFSGEITKDGMGRAEELDDLLKEVQSLIIPFIAQADKSVENRKFRGCGKNLVDEKSPQELEQLLKLELPENAQGKDGVLGLLQIILKYSVNTWDPGFMHKLSGSTNAVGVVAELILSVLNANLHVYQVSPVLTSLEKLTTRQLASMFGLNGPFAGGVTQPGGSASNATAMVVARNNLFPETKDHGYGDRRFVVFTSASSHYSIQKAAQICGFGMKNSWQIDADSNGRMSVQSLEENIRIAQERGLTPFFVNATAGTTVLGAFDPLPEIAKICKREGLWFHVDASWGGSAIFSRNLRRKFDGVEMANSLTVNPHKMLGVPVTCSYLLTPDVRKFWRSNSSPAGYLFHEDVSNAQSSMHQNGDGVNTGGCNHENGQLDNFYDIGDLTLQCGRKGDSLKLALGWIYYGRSGYGAMIDCSFTLASYFASLVNKHPNLIYVGEYPPPCLQVCFYYSQTGVLDKKNAVNTQTTVAIADRLVGKGFMVDYAPGDRGHFLRPVVHLMVNKSTIDRLVESVLEVGRELSQIPI